MDINSALAPQNADVECDRLRRFLYGMPAGLIDLDETGQVFSMNPLAAAYLQGLQVPAVDPLDVWGTLTCRLPDLASWLARAGAERPGHQFSSLIELPPGTLGQAKVLLHLRVGKSDAQRYAVIINDCSELLYREREGHNLALIQAAHLDPLTRLPNRIATLEALHDRLADTHRGAGDTFGVILLNIEDFNELNFSMGTGSGDKILRFAGERLLDGVPTGTFVSRVAGDEFVVLTPLLRSQMDIELLAKRLAEAFCRPYDLGRVTVRISASVGIAQPEFGVDNAVSLLSKAKAAERVAKRELPHKMHLFLPSDWDDVALVRKIREDLRTALDNDGRGLYLVYQPIICARDERCVGFETMVRWQHDTMGVLSPEQFIPIAEESNLIQSLGLWTLKQAVREMALLSRDCPESRACSLSVNVSRLQLENDTFSDELLQAVSSLDFDLSQLQLEVTESAAVASERIQIALKAFKAQGVRIALDDFGTGFSSLSCLHMLPVDVIKIDKSFVDHIQTSEYHRALIRATLDVARSLGLKTIAEGVEHPEQASFLIAQGADKIQGYLFAHPMPLDQLATWLAAPVESYDQSIQAPNQTRQTEYP